MTPAQIIERDLGAAGLLDSVWGVRIMDAVEAGGFSDEDVELASCWTTCACGEQDESLMTLQGPSDSEMFRAGNRFYDAVEDNSYIKATSFLIVIQRRATVLLAQQANK